MSICSRLIHQNGIEQRYLGFVLLQVCSVALLTWVHAMQSYRIICQFERRSRLWSKPNTPENGKLSKSAWVFRVPLGLASGLPKLPFYTFKGCLIRNNFLLLEPDLRDRVFGVPALPRARNSDSLGTRENSMMVKHHKSDSSG